MWDWLIANVHEMNDRVSADVEQIDHWTAVIQPDGSYRFIPIRRNERGK
jgi:hypothetical protein